MRRAVLAVVSWLRVMPCQGKADEVGTVSGAVVRGGEEAENVRIAVLGALGEEVGSGQLVAVTDDGRCGTGADAGGGKRTRAARPSVARDVPSQVSSRSGKNWALSSLPFSLNSGAREPSARAVVRRSVLGRVQALAGQGPLANSVGETERVQQTRPIAAAAGHGGTRGVPSWGSGRMKTRSLTSSDQPAHQQHR